MTKDQLETGMIVEHANGNLGIWISGTRNECPSLPFHKTLKESGTFCNNSFYRRHNDTIELTIPHGEAITGAMLPYNVKKNYMDYFG